MGVEKKLLQWKQVPKILFVKYVMKHHIHKKINY